MSLYAQLWFSIPQPEDAVAIEERNYEAQLVAAQSQQRGRRPAAAAAADA